MSIPGKNHLKYLPTLIQREIIVRLGTEHSLRSLFKAYPSMRVHYDHYERSILQQILRTLFPDDEEKNILKDLLTIPEMNNLRQLHYTFNGILSYRRRKRLSDPADLDELRAVHRLVSRIIIFIEDYLSKATSRFPPRAYMSLPDLSWGTGSKFRGRSLDTKLVPFTTLRRSERYRLLRAFVRYELVCKIHRILPRYGFPQLYDDLVHFSAFHQGGLIQLTDWRSPPPTITIEQSLALCLRIAVMPGCQNYPGYAATVLEIPGWVIEVYFILITCSLTQMSILRSYRLMKNILATSSTH
ncbi:hypothetical protein NW768_007665 [Fusarium equiseti]|uniref:Uncharacterized protein n=1 Tax=Fusarium equiseti TaxID=61235 RepID=A0ABQ8R8B1_FUSEQ|nr:hypothetical protein NW768_007665 [Fusarium equiseti]